jgi:hypothetical protein
MPAKSASLAKEPKAILHGASGKKVRRPHLSSERRTEMKIETTKKAVRTAAGLCLALLYCSGLGLAQDVKYNYMPGTNFAKYHTYKWVNCGGKQPSQITDQEIIHDVNQQLSMKGFTKVTDGASDMYVCYQIAISQQTQWNAFGMGGFRFGGMGTATSSTINNGTLVFDVYDAAAKQQIWQGTAEKTIDPSGNEQKNLKNLSNGIQKLLKNFPPIVKN